MQVCESLFSFGVDMLICWLDFDLFYCTGWNSLNVQMSPQKALRAAMLKSRFADTIFRAKHQAILDNVMIFFSLEFFSHARVVSLYCLIIIAYIVIML